jgi:hypothetical protein
MNKANEHVIKYARAVVREAAYLKDDDFEKLPIELKKSLTNLTAAYNRLRQKQTREVPR